MAALTKTYETVCEHELHHLVGLFVASLGSSGKAYPFALHARAHDARVFLHASQDGGEFTALISPHDKNNGPITETELQRICRHYSVAPIGLVARADPRSLIDALSQAKFMTDFVGRFSDILSGADRRIACKGSILVGDAADIAPVFALEAHEELFPNHAAGLRNIIRRNGGLGGSQRLLDLVSRDQMRKTHERAMQKARQALVVAQLKGAAP